MIRFAKLSVICFALVAGMLAGTAYGAWPDYLATGGTRSIVFVGEKAYGVHKFTTGDTFTPSQSLQVEYLVVAGGGGGAYQNNAGNSVGGGGAGGLLTNSASSLLTISSAQTITVGGGGAAAGGGSDGGHGGNSSIGSLTNATGGGGGGCPCTAANVDGGSGGGAGAWGNKTVGKGKAGQGCDGGNFSDNGSQRAGGGGGGAGGVGGAAPDALHGGAGGNAVLSSITGTLTAYAGGGGGGGNNGGGAGGAAGGFTVGGGGNGGAGAASTGSGGGGAGSYAGAGGSGIVVIRYEIAPPAGRPGIKNLPVTSVTTTSATFNGQLLSNGVASAAVAVLWGETDGGNSWTAWANTNWWNPGDWTDGAIKGTNITTLSPNKTYYYTFGATNSADSVLAFAPLSPSVSFITGDVTVKVATATAQYNGSQGKFQIKRPIGACTNYPLTVYYTLSGSAINGLNYVNTNGGSALPSSVTLGAGVTNVDITVTALPGVNSSLSAVLTLSASNYPCGSPPYSGVITINPAPTPLGRLRAWGGDQSYATNVGTKLYGVHKYTTTTAPMNFTPTTTLACEYLVVAGGGGGGTYMGGGGGAGGVLTNTPASLLTISSAQWITVGGGGDDGPVQADVGRQGANSSIGVTLVATGGGGGGGFADGIAGGSGGGGAAQGTTLRFGGKGTTGQGYDGGNGNTVVPYQTGGGGGGGAAKNGYDQPSSGVGGNGGAGVANSITGTATVYAGGGGAGASTTGGTGGSGIGGNGGSNGSGGNGLNGTGSGGGGRTSGSSTGTGNGGSGIVVIRYEIQPRGAVFMFR